MNVYDKLLSFRGTFRPYQQRVLDEADVFLRDGRVHIVAAPGSGKTTLGIELIRRLGRPALILSPRLVIRDQWLDRVREAFLEEDVPGVLSRDLSTPGLITSVTYQTLYCASTRYRGTVREDDGDDAGDAEEVDFSAVDPVKLAIRAEIGVLCLDECHHLHSEWWKSLESFTAAMAENGSPLTVIALTATPPYDSDRAEWERYTALCGPVDAEIAVPELVAENCLCPHQDYVMLSAPTVEEKQTLDALRDETDQLSRRLAKDAALGRAVASHTGLTDYAGSHERMLDDPAYLSSLLIYLHAIGADADRRWLALLGAETLPPLSAEWLERMLQGFLYDDTESFPDTDELRAQLEGELKRLGLIERRRVCLTDPERVQKLMASSLGKLDSIVRIARSEYDDMGHALRMLILCDYIRGEFKSSIGHPEVSARALGVLPVFETLRRSLPDDCRLGVLCGSIVLLPDDAVEALKSKWSADLSAAPIVGEDGRPIGCSELSITGKSSDIVACVTELFTEGHIEILIGTKALLGEGYDAPCVNSLILASFVGSYVLCNQMRGRAIRVQNGAPEKTANIWHLVCVDEPDKSALSPIFGDTALCSDYKTLERRMKAFLGVSYDGKRIENGVERLDLLRRPFTEANIRRIDEKMLALSRDRDSLRAAWAGAVAQDKHAEIAEELREPTHRLRERISFSDVIGPLAIFFAADLLIHRLGRGAFALPAVASLPPVLYWGVTAVCLFMTVKYGYELVSRLSPLRCMKQVGQAVIDSLRDKGEIVSDVRVMTGRTGNEQAVWLSGGTVREKELFGQCMEEFFAPVDNQRYLLYRPAGMGKYFCVPDILARRKEDASRFAENVRRAVGPFRLVYTRTPEGRAILLRGRTFAWSNISRDISETLNGRRVRRVRQELR